MEAKHEHLQPIPAAAHRLASDLLCPVDSCSRKSEKVECDHG